MYCQLFSSTVITVTEYDGMEYTVAFIKVAFSDFVLQLMVSD